MTHTNATPSVLSLTLAALGLAAAPLGCGSGVDPHTAVDVAASSELHAAIISPVRPAAERTRDVYRHPQETLAFFGLTPSMNVVELAPGTGWYTAILAPTLAEHGKLHVTNADPNGPPESEATKHAKELLARFAASPAAFGKVDSFVVDWKKPSALGPDGSADMVLTFRSVHGWVRGGSFDAVLANAFKVLKPGGVLGIVEHRANPGASVDPKVIGATVYVPEALVIERATAAGFKLAAKSEVNANPKDTKDYPKGVWTLPPTFEVGEVDHAKYATIGESDRMTLRFVK